VLCNLWWHIGIAREQLLAANVQPCFVISSILLLLLPCRLCFPHITAVTQRLIESLAAAGPDVVQDMDLVAQQITIDVIGMAAFDRDLEATVRKPQPELHTEQHTTGAITNSTSGSSSEALNSSSSSESGSGRGIAGRGDEVLEVMRHLVVAMQSRNNPLNRWFPWRKVGTAWHCRGDSLRKHTARIPHRVQRRQACACGLSGAATTCWQARTGSHLAGSWCAANANAYSSTAGSCMNWSLKLPLLPLLLLPLLLLLPQAYRDLMYWGGRMSDLVLDLTADMEAHPPPPHSLGAAMLACKVKETGAARGLSVIALSFCYHGCC
jgi:hypothetical protein